MRRFEFVIERGLGLFVEPAVHAWAEGSDWLIDGTSWMYVNSHFTVTTVSGELFEYARVWQRKNLVLIAAAGFDVDSVERFVWSLPEVEVIEAERSWTESMGGIGA